MSVTLLETIRKNLGFSEMQKVDPNSQEVKEDVKPYGNNSLSQAGIPAVVAALHNFSSTPNGANVILDDSTPTVWMDKIFGNKKNDVIKRIASYTNLSESHTAVELEHIANEAVRAIRQHAGDKKDPQTVVDLLGAQKQETLSYLPAGLQIGELLGEDNLDDRTHKMEGPVSNLMHAIEKQFNHVETNSDTTTK